MPRKLTPQEQQTRQLRAFGLTDPEIEVWFALGAAAGRMLALPVLHPMEQEEVAHDFHKLQNRLLARAGLRAIGWKNGEVG